MYCEDGFFTKLWKAFVWGLEAGVAVVTFLVVLWGAIAGAVCLLCDLGLIKLPGG